MKCLRSVKDCTRLDKCRNDDIETVLNIFERKNKRKKKHNGRNTLKEWIKTVYLLKH